MDIKRACGYPGWVCLNIRNRVTIICDGWRAVISRYQHKDNKRVAIRRERIAYVVFPRPDVIDGYLPAQVRGLRIFVS